ncbi:MAG: (p)ppGpp synthetase, partial [Treponemataceae bacterium]
MKNIISKSFPKKRTLQENYDSYYGSFLKVISELEFLIKDNLSLLSVPTLKSRVKKFPSYYKKIFKSKSGFLGESVFPLVSDLLALRIICPFLEDLQLVG